MRTIIAAFVAVIAVAAFPADGWAQGRSGGRGPSGGGGRSGPVDMPRQGQDLEHGQSSGWEGLRPTRSPQQTSQQQASGRDDHPAPSEKSAAPTERGGVLGTLRRFFGFERSQEVMSEQGREHERATQQERARVDKRSAGAADDEPDE